MPQIHCPSTIPLDTPVLEADKRTPLQDISAALDQEKAITFTGSWPDANLAFRDLKAQLTKSGTGKTHDKRLSAKGHLRRMASRFLIPVEDGEIALAKAPGIGWLDRFYKGKFYLPINDLLGLNSSWQWYLKGVPYPMLRESIHPYYGVYFPTRHAHLHLFDDWLKRNRPGSAMDIGCGCGVLSFILEKHGCREITATDIVPNAVVGMQEDLDRRRHRARFQVIEADLFPEVAEQADCIVFNPPWLPGNIHSITDHGSYYDEPVIERFLSEARNHLKPGGRLVLLFSSLAQDLGLTDRNLVKSAIEDSGEWIVVRKTTAKEQPPSQKSRRQWVQKTRPVEIFQLWELKANDS